MNTLCKTITVANVQELADWWISSSITSRLHTSSWKTMPLCISSTAVEYSESVNCEDADPGKLMVAYNMFQTQ